MKNWRLRPLTDEMLRYAREDTHYLLHVRDVMKTRLLSLSTDPDCPEALLVEIPVLNLYFMNALIFADSDCTMLLSEGICEWRVVIAHSEDENTAKQKPVTT